MGSASSEPLPEYVTTNHDYLRSYNNDNLRRRDSLARKDETRRKSSEGGPGHQAYHQSNAFTVDPFLKGRILNSRVRSDSSDSRKLDSLLRNEPTQAELESYKRSAHDSNGTLPHADEKSLKSPETIENPPGTSSSYSKSAVSTARSEENGNDGLDEISSVEPTPDIDGLPPAFPPSAPPPPGSAHPRAHAPPPPGGSVPPPAPIPPPPPPPPVNGALLKKVSGISQKNSDEKDRTETLPTLQDKWDIIILGFQKMIQRMEVTRKESAYKGMLEDMDKYLNGPYYTFVRKDERNRMGDYLAAETEFAKVVCKLYTDLMEFKKYDHYVENSTSSPTDIVLLVVRNFMWNFTDMSVKLAKRFSENGIIGLLLGDVEAMRDGVMADVDSKTTKNQNHPIFSAFGVLHNCAKASEVKMIYNEHNAVEIILPYIRCKNEAIKATAVMILSYIIDEEKNDLLLADKEVFDFTILTLKKALNSADRRADGFSAYELTEALTGMAKNDTNKSLIVKRGGLKPLVRMLQTGDYDEKTVAAKAIWMLAFNEENKNKMIAYPDLVPILKELKTSTNKRLKKSCEGALWEIEGKGAATYTAGVSGVETDSGTSPSQPHIMLSYNWAHQKLVKKISDALKSSGYKTWIDVEQMEGSTLQAMAEAVENSCAVLVCVSEMYKDSPNCRSEAEYAYRMNKEIIPLMVQPKYRPDGWLGLIVGTKLYYDFSGKHPFEKKLAELVKGLGHRGNAAAKPVPVPEKVIAEKAHPVASSPGQPTHHGVDYSKWKDWEVREWLQKNDVPLMPKLSVMEGKHVAFLKKLSLQAPEFYFNYIERNLGLTDLDSLMKFSDAIEGLS